MNNSATEQQIAYQMALEKVGAMGLDQEETMREVAKDISLKIGVSLEEAFYMLSQALQDFRERENKIKAVFEKLKALAEEIEKAFEIDPSTRRKNRERARIMEEKYRAEIRRCERERPYRRIYKPP